MIHPALRSLGLLTTSGVISWFLFLYEAEPRVQMPQAVRPAIPEISLAPLVEERAEERPAAAAEAAPPTPTPTPVPVPIPVPDATPAPREQAPPPPERGAPEGTEEGEGVGKSDSEPDSESETDSDSETESDTETDSETDSDSDSDSDSEPGPSEVAELMQSPRFREMAAEELNGDARRGFETALQCSAEEQLELARFFGESVLLVPRSALTEDSSSHHYYELEPANQGTIRRVSGTPPLHRFRQYRDLFDFDYASLPDELKALRLKVAAKSEIYLFAVLIPVGEWALVVARRQEALAQWESEQTGAIDEGKSVRRYTLRYEPQPQGGFDIRVRTIMFSDGEIYRLDRDT